VGKRIREIIAHERAARSAGPKGAPERDCAAPTRNARGPPMVEEARMSARREAQARARLRRADT